MAIRSILKKSTVPIRLLLGEGRLDKRSHETIRPDNSFVQADNTRLETRVASRRNGTARVTTFTDPAATNGAWTLGTDHTTYAKVTFASHLQVPAGGWALYHAFKAATPSVATAYILATPRSDNSLGPHTITLTSALLATFSWRRSDGTLLSLTTTVTVDAELETLQVFDPDGGTYTLYISGDQEDQETGAGAATAKPDQEAVDWVFGANLTTSGTTVTGTGFTGKNDQTYLMSFRGQQPAGGTNDFIGELRKQSFQQWPAPWQDQVLLCFDWNESSGSSLIDYSRFKNNGTIFGSPTSGSGIVFPANCGNLCINYQAAGGEKSNVVMVGGELHYEIVKGQA